ncbi:MAG: polysaccharide deacetylase family protein [Aestuariivirga sp.]
MRQLTPRYKTHGTRQVWLTFDDGPHGTNTPRVLDVLAGHGITAVFFLVGRNAAAYPQIVKRMAREGHRIGNHTYNHPDLRKLGRAKVREEILKTEKLIAPFIKGRKLFRPPYGAHNATVDDVLADLGYRLVLWNVDPLDWNKAYQPTKWTDLAMSQIRARSNAVVLAHDIHRTTAAHLDSLIRRIKRLPGTRFQPAASL